ncbi:hypothetical protein GIB67_011421 [Kingdonia uniflora]|uniref:Uncharacterized protein n=1 Tax=Kingdonia uniflora TaxID=39325 RepID=A0A7J7NLN0_9MAGN|nr:hypothetical protein GIB67_011421 [Kingdonia uniflora]
MDLWSMEVSSKVRSINQPQKHTFARLFENNKQFVYLSLLPTPGLRGDIPVINIPESGFMRGLGMEYWEEDTLLTMSKTVVPSKILAEREGFEFFQDVMFGKTPRIFSHCKIIGHIISDCIDMQKEILKEEKGAAKENEVEKKQKKKRNRKKKQNGEGNKGNNDDAVMKSWADRAELDESGDNEVGAETETGANGSEESSEESVHIGNEDCDQVLETQIVLPEVENEVAGNENTCSTLRGMVNKITHDLLCIIKPKVSPNISKLKSLVLDTMNLDVICHDNGIKLPNIWIFWGKIIVESPQHITILFYGNIITFVHAHYSYFRGRELWNELKVIGSTNLPWLMVNDFNMVLRHREKKGGRGINLKAAAEFQEMVDINKLMECNFVGSKYTWINEQMGQDRILYMLDRMLVNKAWADKFSNWRYKVLARTSSDHSPLMGWNIGIPKPRNSPFRYCKMWSSHPNFSNFVKFNWEARLDGDPLFRLAKKPKRLKIGLKEWNTQILVNTERSIQVIYNRILELQTLLEDDVSNDQIEAEMASLKAMRDWLQAYQNAAEQYFSVEKSKLFLGGMKPNKVARVKDLFQFFEGSLPEKYLGFPLMRGRVKKDTVMALVDKIKRRASSWAENLLSLQGRTVLINSVLNSLSIYNMGIYKWPASIIREGEKAIRNFL